MTDHDITELLERAASRAPVGAPPIGRMLAEGQRHRKWRTILAAGICAAAAAAAVTAVTLYLPASEPRTPQPAIAPTISRTELTPGQYKTAVRIAREQIRKTGATITSATATVSRGIVTNTNVGHVCTSGRLLKIKLIGKFPRTVTTGHPVAPGAGTPDGFAVHALNVTADARDGQTCLVGVQTGAVTPAPGSTVLHLS